MNPNTSPTEIDELRTLVRREVVKAQYGTIGELTDAVVTAVQSHTAQKVQEARLDERNKTRRLHGKRNPQYTRQWISDYLGISRPTLNKWLNDPELFTIGAIIKLNELSEPVATLSTQPQEEEVK